MKKQFTIILTLFIAALFALCLILPGCGKDSDSTDIIDGEEIEAVRPNPLDEGKPESYAQAYKKAESIRDVVSNVVVELNEKHNAEVGEGDPTNTSSIMNTFSVMLNDQDLPFTSRFEEDEAAIDAAGDDLIKFGLGDVKVLHPTAHEYGLSFTGSEGGTISYSCMFDPNTGSLRFDKSKDGASFGFYEFADFDNGKYAIQTSKERAYAEFKNGELTSFMYSQKNGAGGTYDSAADSIFPGGGGADKRWVTAGDSYAQIYTFDGKTLEMEADLASGERVSVSIAK